MWDQDQETAIRSPRGGPIISWGGPPVTVRTGRNRLRLDLAPVDGGDPEEEVDRLLRLGATRTEAESLADPGGNEFRLRMAG